MNVSFYNRQSNKNKGSEMEYEQDNSFVSDTAPEKEKQERVIDGDKEN